MAWEATGRREGSVWYRSSVPSEPRKAEPDAAARGARSVLFTAFEPSGDAHAAPVIAELRRRDPDLRIFAWGGPRMEEAGAEVLERTADDGAMGLGGVTRAAAVWREVKRIRRWIARQRILVHVPVDSPAANFPVCKVTKAAGARVVHLVAPQLWAWGSWRIGKVRRLTDGILCLLPFEESWFRSRQVPARFIGHPVLSEPLDEAAVAARAARLPRGAPKIVLLPGSRSGEVRANLKLLVEAWSGLSDLHRGTVGLIVAANESIARRIRERLGDFPTGLHMITGDITAGIRWCDLALNVSGTVSLDVARQHKPMVAVYRTGPVSYFGAKIMLRTPFRLLPNIIAGREIVPEFVPHWVPFGTGAKAVIEAAKPYLSDSRNVAVTAEELRRVTARFAGRDPASAAAETILRMAAGGTFDPPRTGDLELETSLSGPATESDGNGGDPRVDR
jgi:lipid-A-disaccharide synthase